MKLENIKLLLVLFLSFIAAIAFQIPMIWYGSYSLLGLNFLVIFISIFYLYSILEFKNVFYHFIKRVKQVLFLFNVFLFIYIFNRLEFVLGIVDSMAIEKLVANFPKSPSEQIRLLQYINTEYLAFSIGALIMIIVYNSRILASFWSKSTLIRETKL